jgi:hypothetical protein
VSADRRARVLAVLWPPSVAGQEVWAVVDGARDAAIHAALSASRLEFRCLYSGTLPPALERAAPQLVQLWPEHRLTAQLIDDGWGQAWGIVMRVTDPSNLRHHLRKFLRVRDEDDRRLLFRFYDPRVLRTYLPTCVGDELREFFGPIEAFLVEDEEGDGVLEFTRSGDRLVRRRWPLAHEAA